LPNHKGGPYIYESCAQFPIAHQLKTQKIEIISGKKWHWMQKDEMHNVPL